MIYLVCDSTACLSQQEARGLQVIQVPMHYIRQGQSFEEGYTEPGNAPCLTAGAQLGDYSTAQASMAQFADVFARLLAKGHQALCLCISSRLSGTFLNASSAARQMGGDAVVVVDSRSTAGGLYLLLRRARALLDAGHSLQETAAALKALRYRQHTLFTTGNMDPLRRSGRLGMVRLSVSAFLNLRPVLRLADGRVVSHVTARGRSQQYRELLGLIRQPEGPLVVQHCQDPEGAQTLATRLRQQGYQVLLRPLGTVLAIHLGTPCLSVAWVEEG
ncbi:MAG: DegV family EDD domain-containing protein [Clostridiales bacterium]|nr:DegV family EDD domain-containing protein [Clostridiales bacterium]